ncbi:MAG: FkbM family methyltransferase [Alphaproteobacteria bacterium]|nr:FkbM family methyltransferase [Alphaproteobacteria bacterium]
MDNSVIEAIKRSFPPSLHAILNIDCPIKIVDIGANPIDGPAPYAPLLGTGHASVVGFEPNLESLAKLNERKGPNDVYLPHAVGDGQRHTLRHCLLPGMTSLLEPNQTVLGLFAGFPEWAKVVRTEEVDTVRLDDVPETAGLDYLKIDIQGGELMVFKNARKRLRRALVVQTEVEFLPMYVGQPLFSEVEQYMRRQGYVLHKFFPLVTRDVVPLLMSLDPYEGHSQVVWADAVFVRDFTRLEKLDDDQLLRSAIILYDCYRSFDLVLHLLREHDRRTQRGYGEAFFRIVSPLLNVAGSKIRESVDKRR